MFNFPTSVPVEWVMVNTCLTLWKVTRDGIGNSVLGLRCVSQQHPGPLYGGAGRGS